MSRTALTSEPARRGASNPKAARFLKILLVTSARDGGNWFVQIARQMKARGHDVTVVLPGEGTLSSALEKCGIRFQAMPLDVAFLYRDKEKFLDSVESLSAYIEKHQFDVVEYCLFPALVVARLASFRCGVPSRVQLTTGPYNMDSPILKLVEMFSSWMETTVLATSQCIKRQYRKIGVPEKRLPVIHFGHDHERFSMDRVGRAASRQWLLETQSIPLDAPLVSMVSRFYAPLPDSLFIPRHLRGRPSKSHDMLIEAVPLVLNAIPDAYFLLAGGAWGATAEEHVEALKNRVRQLGVEERVIFPGNMVEIEKVNAATDVSVQCSNTENVCGAVVEALLMERAVVATNVGALNEPIVHGETGLLVTEGDHRELAASIVKLLEEPELRARLGRNGRQRMLARHTLDVVIPQLESRYLLDCSRREPRAFNKPVRKQIASVTMEVLCHILALPYYLMQLSHKRSHVKSRIFSFFKKMRPSR